MKTNKEVRAEAWRIVRTKWFGRIFAAGLMFYTLIVLVFMAIATAFEDMNIQTWTDFLKAKFEAAMGGLDYAVPSAHVFWQMTGASAFENFIGYIFGAIFIFGMTGLMLKAVRNDETRWLADSFSGFSRPLELAWLLVLMNLKVFLWSLLFVVPGIVALYRYRQAWYLKSETPDWSAAKCIAESGKMMEGRKWQAFCLDMSYLLRIFCVWLAVVLLAAPGLSGRVDSPVMALAGQLLGLAGLGVLVYLLVGYFVGRTVFYREVACARARDMV